MNTTWRQVSALVALRWRMVRSRRLRAGLVLLGVAVLAVATLAVAGARLAPPGRFFNAAIVTPTAFAVYLGLALLGPLAAGGGSELFPADELVPHPVRATTTFYLSLLLTPLNIAWVGQTTALLSLSAYVAGRWSGVPAALTLTMFFAVATTICGQAIAWGVNGARQTRWGRRAAWTAVAATVAAVGVTLHVGVTQTLDRLPTRWLVVAMLQGAAGDYHRWGWALVLLAGIAAVGLALGVRTTAYTLRRPPGVGAEQQARSVVRRRPRRSVVGQLRAIDRAAVWRAPALRRGIVVMGLLPGAAAAAARVEWPGLALTGGLVTAGAGLLFGVNAFCLDGGGSLWLASLPLSPRDHIRAKAWTLAEVCAACSALTVLAGATRARGGIGAVEVATVLANVCACTVVVVASCLRSSVLRPHRADMRGPRDTPAPPGAMAAHSARLATQTTLVGLLVTGVAITENPAAPLLAGLAVVLLATISLRRSMQLYTNPAIRAKVTITVATG